jgi:transcriptional regulator with XRE-family HTH domain
MVQDSRIEERMRLNKPFITAFDYLKDSEGLTQDETAKRLGTNSSLISLYRKGKKLAGKDIKTRLGIAFGGRLYMPYLDGVSPYMLVKNVPDDELLGNIDREDPDFAQIKKDKEKRQAENAGQPGILELYHQLILEVEQLRTELNTQLREVKDVREQLTQEREALQNISQQLTATLMGARGQYPIASAPIPLAADGTPIPPMCGAPQCPVTCPQTCAPTLPVGSPSHPTENTTNK